MCLVPALLSEPAKKNGRVLNCRVLNCRVLNSRVLSKIKPTERKHWQATYFPEKKICTFASVQMEPIKDRQRPQQPHVCRTRKHHQRAAWVMWHRVTVRLERTHRNLMSASPLLFSFQHVFPTPPETHYRLVWFVIVSSCLPENLAQNLFLTDGDLQSTFDGVVVEVSSAVGSSEHQEHTAEAPVRSLLPFLSVREPRDPQGKQAVAGARFGAEHGRCQRTPHTCLWRTHIRGGWFFIRIGSSELSMPHPPRHTFDQSNNI